MCRTKSICTVFFLCCLESLICISGCKVTGDNADPIKAEGGPDAVMDSAVSEVAEAKQKIATNISTQKETEIEFLNLQEKKLCGLSCRVSGEPGSRGVLGLRGQA